MATDEERKHVELLAELSSPDWSVTLEAVSIADARLRTSIAGDANAAEIVVELVNLATHSKWEVRRAVANAAACAFHPGFEGALAKLALDDNSRVRQAAEQAALKRRDSRYASTLGKQHEDRVNLILDDIAARFGTKGRDAVKRAGEQIANTFARELYHEVIKLVSPLAASAERLQQQLVNGQPSAEILAAEAERIGRRVGQLRAILDAMRAYTALPVLSFKTEVLKDVVQEAASVAIENDAEKSRQPLIEIDVSPTISVDIVRSRFVQALTNVLLNAIEAYRGVPLAKAIRVSAHIREGIVTLDVKDSGCGMSAESQKDALTLFATSKPTGTGFGLPLASKIVESEHAGRLSIESTKGSGTTVRVVIPMHRQLERP